VVQGYRYSTDGRLPERDLQELADILAMQLHNSIGTRVYLLPRSDISELIEPYIDDLFSEDRQAISWMVWHLIQDAMEMEFGDER
jgi:hypothetical protein